MFNVPHSRKPNTATATLIFLTALITSACGSDKSQETATTGMEKATSAMKSAAPTSMMDNDDTEATPEAEINVDAKAATETDTKADTKTNTKVMEVTEAAKEAVAEVTEEVTEKAAEVTAMLTPKAEDKITKAVPAVKQKVQEVVASAQQAVSAPSEADSLALARKSGCLACHAVDKKVVGPSWNDVAKRYAGKPDAKNILTGKVKKGGRGNWTDVVGNAMMPPYSPRVSDDNIEKLVDFIISLNK